MQFTKIILLALTGASVSALPVEENGAAFELETRDTVVTCTPDVDLSGTRTYQVSMSYAEDQAKEAGFTVGGSGDPHNYSNVDKIRWGVKGCNTKGAQLWEYPIYWNVRGSTPKEWKKGERSAGQDKTPIRVVYILDSGTHDGRPKVCGVMTHSNVDGNHQGNKFFKKCV